MASVERYFRLLQAYGVTVLRLLLTPYDTFWMWRHWSAHPYNCRNGGPCPDRGQWLLSLEMRTAIKQRYAFTIERWGKAAPSLPGICGTSCIRHMGATPPPLR